ncbi:hypothetical protein ACFWY9_28630 [Amycolatopsis sp. NPDC059027]|uniref:VG15 protein n=1 Tax=Amycolatopsis sp. NPDC059027 TaxID=3346709 RepID=UPI003672459D
MPSSAQIAEAGKAAQNVVRAAALKRSLTAWRFLDPRRIPETTGSWSLILLEIIRSFRTQSAGQALVTYNDLRPGDAWFQPIPELNTDRILHSLLVTGPGRILQLQNQGMKPDEAHAQAFKLHARAVSSAVVDAGRELTESAIHEDQTALGFARMPSPGACAFCLMLASRGAVYSKTTVLTTTSRSKKRGSGKSFHEGCNCSMFPVFSKDQELPDRIADAERLYEKASAEGGGTKAILAEMRKLGGVK